MKTTNSYQVLRFLRNDKFGPYHVPSDVIYYADAVLLQYAQELGYSSWKDMCEALGYPTHIWTTDEEEFNHPEGSSLVLIKKL